jgi:hypothetical protein
MSNVSVARVLARRINPAWPKPVKFLAGGMNGRVYETNDGRLMKFVYSLAPQEYMALQKLQGAYVVPRFHRGNGKTVQLSPYDSANLQRSMFPNSNKSSYVTAFVMGRAGGSSGMTLHKYLKTYPTANRSNIQRRVEYLVEQMALRGVSHGDLHPGNIIVTVSPSGRISGMWAIDFGRARGLSPGKTERQTLNAYRTSNMFGTHSMYPPFEVKNVPVRNGSRANVHMMNVVYGKRLSPSWEGRVARLRKQVLNELKNYKSPRRSAPKAKSVTPGRKRVSPRKPRSA